MLAHLFRPRWTPKRLAHWETIRTKGKAHFIFWNGVVFFGSFMFLVTTAFQLIRWWWLYGTLLPSLTVYLMIQAIVWPIGGYLYGRGMWYFTERSYHAHRQGYPPPE